MRTPKPIDTASATKAQLVAKVNECAKYIIYLKKVLAASQAEVADIEKERDELLSKLKEFEQTLLKQQSEIQYMDRNKSDEFRAVEERAGRIEDTVAQIHDILRGHDAQPSA